MTKRPLAPLVLLAGLLCDETIFADVCTELPTAPVAILSFPDMDSIGAMAKRVLAEAPSRFALVGHSMGGRVALEVLRLASERVLGLSLLNTGVHPRREGEIESRGRLVRLANERGMAALADEWLPPMMGASVEVQQSVLPRLRAMVERASPTSFAAQIQALLNRPDASHVLPGIRVPTLLASGTHDQWSPLSQHEAMLGAIRGGRLVAIENAGHMMPLEQPRAVAAAINEWWSAL